jgi:hypothetical protein
MKTDRRGAQQLACYLDRFLGGKVYVLAPVVVPTVEGKSGRTVLRCAAVLDSASAARRSSLFEEIRGWRWDSTRSSNEPRTDFERCAEISTTLD